MGGIEQYLYDSEERIKTYPEDEELMKAADKFRLHTSRTRFSYNFTWCGIPIIQSPWDIHAFQELVWEIKPEVIVETGIAFGGSLMLSSSMLSILEETNNINKGIVIGIDIEIKKYNKDNILNNPLSNKIILIERSSIDKSTIQEVKEICGSKKVLVCLDSNHTHKHVLEELKMYTPIVSKNSYCIVYDTGISKIPECMLPSREWNRNRNPASAVNEFIKDNKYFIVDKKFDNKYLIPSAIGGYLKRIK